MTDQFIEVIVRYNGYFTFFLEKNRVIYRGGSMRSFIVDIDRTSLKDLLDDVKSSFKENDFLVLRRLAYFVHNVMPIQFKYIETDADYLEMLHMHLEVGKCTLYLPYDFEGLPGSKIPAAITECQKYQSIAIGTSNQVEIGEENLDLAQVVKEADEIIAQAKKLRLFNEKVDDTTPQGSLRKKTSQGFESEDVGLHIEDNIEHCNAIDNFHDYYSGASDADDDCAIEDDDDDTDTCEGSDDPLISIGKTFDNMEELKNCLRQHAIRKKFQIKVVKSDKSRYIVECAGLNCGWKLRGILHREDMSTVEIRTMTSTHTCIGGNLKGNSQASANWIGKKIVKLVKNNRNLTPKEIGDFVREEYQLCSIPYSRLWRARDVSRELVFGDVDENYSYVPSLRAELLKRNVGSHIEYQLGGDHSFLRFFLSFKCIITGFKEHCRPFIGLDGCHLRGKYLGCLLSAVALDGNNGIYPLAFAVVEGEGFETWMWFLEHLRIALGGEVEDLTLMSDMEKGLEEAMRCVMPSVEHRICMRHLWKNLKKSYPGEFYERVVWLAARAYTGVDMWTTLRELKNKSEDAFSALWVKGKDLDGNRRWVWSRSDFRTSSKNQYITNNLSESFNAWIMGARNLPVCDLIDKMREKIMHLMYLRRQQSKKWIGTLTPMAEKYLQELSRENNGFQKVPSGSNEWEVSDGTIRKMVDIGKKVCSCRRWQVTGFPCTHAMTILGSIRNIKWEDFVDEYYHKSRYIEAYKDAIAVMPSKDEWEEVNLPYKVGSPYSKRPRGRPKKERIRGDGEKRKLNKSKMPHRCGRCGGWGHHSNTCKEPLNPLEQSHRSQNSRKGGKKRRSADEGSSSQQQPILRGHTHSQVTVEDNWIASEFHISPIKHPRKNESTSTTNERGKRKPLRGRGGT